MDKDLIALSAELAFVQDDLSIMQHRMGSTKLQWSVHADPAPANRAVPPALLLSLVKTQLSTALAPH